MARVPFRFTLKFKLVAMMLLLSLGLVTTLVLLYYQSEKVLYNEFERRTSELSRAIQFGLEEVSGRPPTRSACGLPQAAQPERGSGRSRSSTRPTGSSPAPTRKRRQRTSPRARRR
jgi:hypothetical protein